MIRKTARGIHFHRNRHPSGSGCPFGVPTLRNPWSDGTTDRLLFVLGAVALVIVLGWEAVSYAVFFFRIPLANPTAYFVASAVIPSSGATALILLIGWGIQTRRRHPPILFLAFVLVEVAGWAIGLATRIWFFIVLGGPGFELLLYLSALTTALDLTALFLLLVLALPPRSATPFLQPSPAQPSGPTP